MIRVFEWRQISRFLLIILILIVTWLTFASISVVRAHPPATLQVTPTATRPIPKKRLYFGFDWGGAGQPSCRGASWGASRAEIVGMIEEKGMSDFGVLCLKGFLAEEQITIDLFSPNGDTHSRGIFHLEPVGDSQVEYRVLQDYPMRNQPQYAGYTWIDKDVLYIGIPIMVPVGLPTGDWSVRAVAESVQAMNMLQLVELQGVWGGPRISILPSNHSNMFEDYTGIPYFPDERLMVHGTNFEPNTTIALASYHVDGNYNSEKNGIEGTLNDSLDIKTNRNGELSQSILAGGSGPGQYCMVAIFETQTDDHQPIEGSYCYEVMAKLTDHVAHTVRASSTLPADRWSAYSARFALDGAPDTAWVEGVDGSGIGQWIEVDFGEPVEIYYVGVDIGYDKSNYLFRANNRLRTATITLANGIEIQHSFSDIRGIQMVPMMDAAGNPRISDSLKLVIEEIYQGRRYDDTAVAEIEVWGDPPLPIEEAEESRVFVVVYPGLDGLSLRSGPGSSHDELAILRAHTELTVLGGPVFNDSVKWWSVSSLQGEGWIAEWIQTGQRSWRLVKPQLSQGQAVVVVNPIGPGQANLRDDQCQVQSVLAYGTAMTILDGPASTCDDPGSSMIVEGREWFYVKTADGREGWIADFSRINRALLIAPIWYTEVQ